MSLILTVWGARRAFPIPRMIVTTQMMMFSIVFVAAKNGISIGIGFLILLVVLILFWINLRETAQTKPDQQPDQPA